MGFGTAPVPYMARPEGVPELTLRHAFD